MNIMKTPYFVIAVTAAELGVSRQQHLKIWC
jgi:hypothetical protein